MRQVSGTLSGGEQQCSRPTCIDDRPRLLLMDEPSMGLAPSWWSDLRCHQSYQPGGHYHPSGGADALMALSIAHRGTSSRRADRPAGYGSNLKSNEMVQKAYLGVE